MQRQPSFVLIGAGIMSAALGVLLKSLIPKCKIHILERLDKVAAESSNVWNNAGTGHSAFCELNYTPIDKNGRVDLSKALRISQSFEESKQLWAYMKESGQLPASKAFINDIPHISFVWGEHNVRFLDKRYQAMSDHAIFKDMEYSENSDEIRHWLPLMMEGRGREYPVAATKMDIGTDVNFGALTKGMIEFLRSCDDVEINLGHEVSDLTRMKNGEWKVDIEVLEDGKEVEIYCDRVFIGAGGGALPLLDQSGIKEGKGYGGFPVSGQFLHCTNEEVVNRHFAKAYGKAAVGSPPMSVPHLDTRWIDGNQSLLFGPYAGFSTKFLKNGSYMDLFLSIEMHNVWPILSAGINNVPLTRYLIDQVTQSFEERFALLQDYYPNANIKDWKNIEAGQRVQIIKKDKKEGGKLKFGTELVCSEDKTMTALLGASPGASTSVSIMFELLGKMYPKEIKSPDWIKKIRQMIPSYGHSLIDDDEMCAAVRNRTTDILRLED